MVLSITVLVLVLAITYMHFTEGFFSATISAISAVLAAVLAVGYSEPLAQLMLRQSGADCIHAISLVLLFIAGYVAIRVSFDKLIPGNVRTPATLDKIGAAAMGLVAGTFAVGIFVIALQMLPFGPTISVFGYTRWPVGGSRAVLVHGGENQSDTDATVNNQMTDDTLDPAKETGHLWLPADDLVMNTVYRLSDNGSLAGARPLASVHPDWLGELFGQRLGQQAGTRRVILVVPGAAPISIGGVFTANNIPAYDGYGKPGALKRNIAPDAEIRPMGYKSPFGDTLTTKGDQVALIVRVKLRSTATDDPDKIFRFGPGTIRLVTRPVDADGNVGLAKDYYPVGMYENGKVVTSRVDDFLFVDVKSEGGFDAVFIVDKSTLAPGGKNKGPTVAPGTFIDVKRVANLDLSGQAVTPSPPPDGGQPLIRPDAFKYELKAASSEQH